jgi:2-polyprenyl-3-methyl-5-hydroxy-6-metoxy-1,4-benzoquinol methylase
MSVPAIEPSSAAVIGTEPPRACPVCGAVSWRPLYLGVKDYLTDESFDVLICNDCHQGLTHPIPKADEVSRYYPSRYRGNRHGFTDRFRTLRRSADLARHFPRGFRGRLLDIGCGAGSFALHQQTLGWKVTATEVDAALVDQLRGRGLDVHLASDSVGAIAGPFDAITCWHVLEHVEDVHKLLEWVHSLLKPDGVFQVGVPNFSSLQAGVFGKQWLHLDVPRHFYHFRADGLQRLLEQNGLETHTETTFVLEYDWFGAIQSTLNLLCTKPNLLFERLTVVENDESASKRDLVLSWVLGPILAVITFPICLACWAIGRGASLGFSCRRTVSAKREGFSVHYRMHRDPMSSHQQVTRMVCDANAGPVLDVGCAQGTFGQLLSGSGLVVDAIEPNPAWAQIAKSFYRNVHVAYIENAELPVNSYRTIICADVLEHMPDPVSELKRLRAAATDDAVFVISVPNVAHIGVRLLLLCGLFPKMERGILDKTHLHFYTLKTAKQMIESAGLSIEKVKATPVPLDEIWKGGEGKLLFRFAAFVQRMSVKLLPRLFGMQWIFVARNQPVDAERQG